MIGDRMAALDIDLLRCFVIVSETASFTTAAGRLMRTQPTVSLQIKRLEEALGQTLLERSPKHVAPTADGLRLLPQARRLIELHDNMLADLRGENLQGLVRLGTPEDFATMHLPHVLARFADTYPEVTLEVTCDLTLNLIDRFRIGGFDLVLIKREPHGIEGGAGVWRERLVWAARDVSIVDRAMLPLVVAPQPCVYRKRAIEALKRSGQAHRVAYTSPSLAGAQAAVRAGLGMAVLPRRMVPDDFVVLGEEHGLPDLEETEIALLFTPALSRPAAVLADHIRLSLEEEAKSLSS
jgi:DNA-binding transcriptional LysR family regulator